MKKKLLNLAMMAGLAAAAGSAQAVHVNNDGLGQVLLYPYYTVEGGYESYVQVVNTQNVAKAVKVRFLEGKNSQEVLDFNLYLSPYDVWTGVLTRSAAGTLLTTADKSCTAPAIPAGGVEFRNSLFEDDSVSTTARTREGYVEMIEMGNLVDNDANGNLVNDDNESLSDKVTHVNGVPRDCAAIRTAAGNGAGALNNQALATLITAPTGGLYGYGVYINVNRGLDYTVDAVALDNFFVAAPGALHLHYVPGDELPSLADVNQNAFIVDGANVIDFNVTGTAIDAVSATIMHDTIMNSYQTAPEIQGATDWVVTFPTKRFYVNTIDLINNATLLAGPDGIDDFAFPPFQNGWDSNASKSCDSISIKYYDREERAQAPTAIDFSPSKTTGIAICNEVNTISINAATGDSIFAATTDNTRANLNLDYTAGWMSMTFNSVPAATIGLTGSLDVNGVIAASTQFFGLPVIGFSADQLVNGTLNVGGVNVLSNYGGESVHKATRNY